MLFATFDGPGRHKMNQSGFATPAKIDALASTASPKGVSLRGYARISVPEIARRLNIGRQGVYAMLEQGMIPAIRLGRRWIITRHAYERWERTCGEPSRAGLHTRPEVTV